MEKNMGPLKGFCFVCVFFIILCITYIYYDIHVTNHYKTGTCQNANNLFLGRTRHKEHFSILVGESLSDSNITDKRVNKFKETGKSYMTQRTIDNILDGDRLFHVWVECFSNKAVDRFTLSEYRQIYNIRSTKSQKLKVYRVTL